jgi:hypothetical protein
MPYAKIRIATDDYLGGMHVNPQTFRIQTRIPKSPGVLYHHKRPILRSSIRLVSGRSDSVAWRRDGILTAARHWQGTRGTHAWPKRVRERARRRWMMNRYTQETLSAVLSWGVGEAECIHTGLRLESFRECGMGMRSTFAVPWRSPGCRCLDSNNGILLVCMHVSTSVNDDSSLKRMYGETWHGEGKEGNMMLGQCHP